jgi:hypothetical protein
MANQTDGQNLARIHDGDNNEVVPQISSDPVKGLQEVLEEVIKQAEIKDEIDHLHSVHNLDKDSPSLSIN